MENVVVGLIVVGFLALTVVGYRVDRDEVRRSASTRAVSQAPARPTAKASAAKRA